MPNWGAAANNAAQYGATGMMFGPWGAGIGAGYGFLTGLFQDDGQIDIDKLLGPDLDRARERSAQNAALGGKLIDQSSEGLTPALSYFRDLLSNNPATLMQATAPDRGRVIDQYDTARKAMAEFGPRGGGQTSAAGAARVAQGNALQEILSTARDKGAAGAAAVGGTLLQGGLQATSLASQDLSTVINSILSSAGLQVQQQGQQQQMDAAQGEAMGTMLGLLLTRGKVGGGRAGGSVGTAGIGGAIQPNLGAGL